MNPADAVVAIEAAMSFVNNVSPWDICKVTYIGASEHYLEEKADALHRCGFATWWANLDSTNRRRFVLAALRWKGIDPPDEAGT